MPSRERTIADAIHIFNNVKYPEGLNPTTAWLGIYQTLLWYEPINFLGFSELPHIIEADSLRPASPAKKSIWIKPNVWQKRAQALSKYLAENLGVPINEIQNSVNLLMRQPDYERMQRQNPLGIAFAGIVKHILERFGSQEISYELEVEADSIFPGISFPGRSTTPRIDILGKHGDIPIVIITAKWSARHDRLNDITNECPVYKAGYARIFRQTRRDQLLYYAITNEYGPARLHKMLGDTCVDGVVHVHKPAVVNICCLDGRLNKLMDLADLINVTWSWK